ncbi:MAG: hypothetical protein V4494_07400, partial [Chlamydiota bacterium]
MSNNIILDPDLDRYICPVYMTDLEGDARTLNCGHSFSSQFIGEVYKKSIALCPVCRGDIKSVTDNNYSLNEALGQNKDLRRENDNLRQENVVLRGRVNTLEGILENMNTTMEKVSSQLELMHNRTNAVENENHKLSLQIQEDRTKHKDLCNDLNNKITEGNNKYDALEKKFEEDTLSLKTQIAEKNKPVYYPSDSD